MRDPEKYSVSKHHKKWLVLQFLGWDKMESEYKILGEFYNEKTAKDYKEYLDNLRLNQLKEDIK